MRALLFLIFCLIKTTVFGQVQYGEFKITKTDRIFPHLTGHYKAGSGSQDTVVALENGVVKIRVVDEFNIDPYESSCDTIQIYFTPEFIISILGEDKSARVHHLKDSITKHVIFEKGKWSVSRILNPHIEEFAYHDYKVIEGEIEYMGYKSEKIEYTLEHKKYTKRRHEVKAILTKAISFPTKKLMEFPYSFHKLPLYMERSFDQFKVTRRVIDFQQCTLQEIMDRKDVKILKL